MSDVHLWAWPLLVPVLGGSLFSLLQVWASLRLFAGSRATLVFPAGHVWPTVSILKPCYGVDKELESNLASACRQDYPGEFEVIFSVQREGDPALPVIRRVAERCPCRVTVVARDCPPAVNGKIQNLANALPAARGDILVISDSDIRLTPDYLRRIVAPFDDPGVGFVCTLYRAVAAERWYERLELLTLNADFTPSVIFAAVTGASDFCLGSSIAIRRKALAQIGGFTPLADYLVEDYELGRRLTAAGFRSALVPHLVDVVVDLDSPRAWWDHLVYWDQNTRVIHPIGFFFTLFTRGVPFAALFWLATGLSGTGGAVVAAAVAIRLAAAAAVALKLNDRESLRNIWLLPLRDLAGVVSWATVLVRRSVVWRGRVFDLGRDGRMIPRAP
jgi:ceramide glucosyltransferase